MKEKIDPDLRWRPIVIFGIVAVVTAFIADAWPGWDSFCPRVEVNETSLCVRNWMGAASGYFATAAAAATILFLHRQHLEQKKQTDFLLGDAPPTIDAIQHQNNPYKTVIRIVNWNRRPIVVQGLTVPSPQFDTRIQDMKLFDRERKGAGFRGRHLLNGNIDPPVAMHGWKNRSIGPCELRIDIEATDKKTGELADDWSNTTVSLEVIVAGETTSKLMLSCPVTVAE